MLHHDSMCNLKPNEETQKFLHIIFSTYMSKLSKTKECIKGALERGSQARPQQRSLLRSRAQAWKGVPPTPILLLGTKSKRAWCYTSHNHKTVLTPLPWLQDYHITSPHTCYPEAEAWSTKGVRLVIWISGISICYTVHILKITKFYILKG